MLPQEKQPPGRKTSSHRRRSVKKCVPKSFAKFLRKTHVPEFLTQVLPVNSAKILRTLYCLCSKISVKESGLNDFLVRVRSVFQINI